jgi:phosphatidylserine/phosphatidylglycerophosphate/cardiolipin synthase-like enzyme
LKISKLFFLFIYLFFAISTATASSQLYFLPNDTKKAQNKILELFKNSKENIDIAMYNFKYKKFIKALKKAHNKNIDIKLYLDRKKAKDSKIDFIEYKTFKNKQHIKAIVFDKKTVVFGSANWKKESFEDNFEVIYISDDKKMVKKFNNMFNQLSKL